MTGGFHDVCWRYGGLRTGEPRCQEPGTWPHQKNIYILECVCVCRPVRDCVYIHGCQYMCMHTPCGLGGCYGPWKATDIVYLSVAWDSFFDSVLLTFWKRLPVSNAQTLLAQPRGNVAVTELGLWLLCPTENCCWCLLIGIPYPFNGKRCDLECLEVVTWFPVILKVPKQLNVWE